MDKTARAEVSRISGKRKQDLQEQAFADAKALVSLAFFAEYRHVGVNLGAKTSLLAGARALVGDEAFPELEREVNMHCRDALQALATDICGGYQDNG